MVSWQVSTAMHLYPDFDRDLRSCQGNMLTSSLGHFEKRIQVVPVPLLATVVSELHQMALIFPFNTDSSLPSGSVYTGIRLHCLKVSVAKRCCFAVNPSVNSHQLRPLCRFANSHLCSCPGQGGHSFHLFQELPEGGHQWWLVKEKRRSSSPFRVGLVTDLLVHYSWFSSKTTTTKKITSPFLRREIQCLNDNK